MPPISLPHNSSLVSSLTDDKPPPMLFITTIALAWAAGLIISFAYFSFIHRVSSSPSSLFSPMAMPRVQHISLPPSEPNCVHIRQDVMLWYDEVDADESMRRAASNITASKTSNASVTTPTFNCSLKRPDKNVTFHDPITVPRPISPILMGMARDGSDSCSDSSVTLVMRPRHKVCPWHTLEMWSMRLIVPLEA
jgi:hypothetical protein